MSVRIATHGRWTPSSSPTATRQPRAALDRAWPGWDDGVGLVIAADGGARHAAELGVGSIAGSATAIRSGPAASPR